MGPLAATAASSSASAPNVAATPVLDGRIAGMPRGSAEQVHNALNTTRPPPASGPPPTMRGASFRVLTVVGGIAVGLAMLEIASKCMARNWIDESQTHNLDAAPETDAPAEDEFPF
jgi:hypothetical protein